MTAEHAFDTPNYAATSAELAARVNVDICFLHNAPDCAECKPRQLPQTSPLANPPPPAPVDLDEVAAAWYKHLRDIDAQAADLKAKRERAVEHLQAAMGDAHEARIGGLPAITWRPSKPGKQLDRKALEAAYGKEVIAGFEVDKKAARPFKILDVEDGA